MLQIKHTIALRMTLLFLAGFFVNSVSADRTTSYTYNTQGQIATVDGPRTDVSDITVYDYDAKGNRSLIRDALRHETQVKAFDNSGRPLIIVDPNGLMAELSYDPRGRLTGQAQSDGTTTRTTSYRYDPVGNLIQITSPDGSELNCEYDPANRLVGLSDGEGNHIDYTLDAMGNRLESRISDPGGALRYRQRQIYNQLGRLIQNIDAQGNAADYAYDSNGNLAQTTDARDHPTRQEYDPLGRVRQTKDALDGVTRYTYDPQGNITSVTDPNGLITTYEYDGLGNLLTRTSPDTGTTTYSYDEAGNRLSQTDARGVTVTYGYDALNRLTAVHYPDSSHDIAYVYDQGANGIGHLTSMSDANGNTSYSYNAFGQLTGKIRTASDGTITHFSYAYDDFGRLASQTYPSGRAVNYGYAAQGHLDSVTLVYPDGTTQTIVHNIKYLPFGPIESFDYGNGLNLTRSFDLDYRLVEQVVSGILQSSYHHDSVGNIIRWRDLLDTGRDQLFEYDALDRLTSASGVYGDLGYSYDATGNRLSITDGFQTEIYNYTPNTHRLQQILGSVTDSRSYDAAGNTVQNLIGSYSYDAANRMVGFTKADIQAEYAYNGDGERIGKVVNGSLTRFRYGDNAQLLGEYDQDGEALREYIYLSGQPVAMVARDLQSQTDSIYYLHTDHLGAVVKATDQAQVLVWDAVRRPFGTSSVTTAQVEMPLGFPGQYFDEESGNYYNYFRDYDPSTGRYLQSDPIGLSGGLNTYSYVGANPLQFSDPYGLVPNPAELTCVDPLQPICWGGVATDIITTLLGGGALAGTMMMSGDTPVDDPATDSSECDDGGGNGGGDCRKASPWHLDQLGIVDAHAFKQEFVLGSISKYDICICKDGTVKLKAAGKCGKSGPSIDTGLTMPK